MNAMTLALNQVVSDPFDRPQVETVRFTMYRRLIHLSPCLPLPGGYELEPWSLRSTAECSAILKLAYTCSPDMDVYSNLTTHRGCARLLDELTDMTGFLPDASWVVTKDGVPCAAILSGCTAGGVFGQIHVVAVVPRHRRRGLATFLIRKALWALRDRGLSFVTLHVNRANRGAIRFFRSADFQVNASSVY
jgi:GNAT superfamily N-acetyltransferase